jgi:mono/diheme cytochrome c family protein
MKALFIIASMLFLTPFWHQEEDELAESIARGKEVYMNNCIVCHMGKGEGVAKLNPPLAGSDYLFKTPDKAIRAIKYGLQEAIEVNGVKYKGMMPEPGLENEEIADVMNYISNSWGNKSEKIIDVKTVEGIKK